MAKRDQSSGDTRRETSAAGESVRLEALANLAHELRSPLQALLGYLDIMREDWAETIPAEPRAMLERMNVNLHDLVHTVDNIMEFVMADAGAAPRVFEDITVSSLVTDLAPGIEAASHGKPVAVRFDLENAPGSIHSSRRALRLILSNLVLNAIKFTERGNVTVRIAAADRANRTAAEHEVDIEVSDTGIGINPALMEEASRPLAQLSHTNTRKFRGLGLGLTVVRRNVRALGATLEVKSAPGQGSRFLLRIPPAHLIAQSRRNQQRLPAMRGSGASAPPPHKGAPYSPLATI